MTEKFEKIGQALDDALVKELESSKTPLVFRIVTDEEGVVTTETFCLSSRGGRLVITAAGGEFRKEGFVKFMDLEGAVGSTPGEVFAKLLRGGIDPGKIYLGYFRARSPEVDLTGVFR
jgi:hypothetical protein